MEFCDNRVGAGRRIERDEAEMAAAVFLSVHRECGEAAQIYPGKGKLTCYCDSCFVSRIYTYEMKEERASFLYPEKAPPQGVSAPA